MTSLSVRERRRLAALCKQARSAPVFCERHGKPRLVVIAVEEYAKLKLRVDDPLGYDTSDPDYVRRMAEDALSGKTESTSRPNLRRSGGGFASRSQARKLGRTRVTPKAAWAFLAPGVSSHHESREALAVNKVAELTRIGDVLGPVKKIELRTPPRDIGETHNESRDRNSERGNAGGRSNGTSSDDEAPQRN